MTFRPLSGYKVLDCSRLLPYQYCTLLLGDLGAEVLKIEEPGRGDYGRWFDLATPGVEKLSFRMANRNKKSMTLNLKTAKGREIFKRLASRYDVLLESFRPGVMNRLGLGYRAIRKLNPKIIYCSGTGYGQKGPYRLKAGHDINYLSIAGILGAAGWQKGRPTVPGIPIADMAGGGLFSCLAILSALLGRERTGQGQYIDVAMTDVMASFNIINIASALEKYPADGVPPYHTLSKCLAYNVYRTKDDKYISLGNVERRFWANFCRVVGREDLVHKQYYVYQDGEETTETLKDLFLSRTLSEWLQRFADVDHCFAPVNTPEEAIRDPNLVARGIIKKVKDAKRSEIIIFGFPALFSGGLVCSRRPAPGLGIHTSQMLKEIGCSPGEIKQLKKAGVI